VFKLTIEDDEGKTTVVPLIRDEITIGRQEGNTIRLTERNISRRHARLMRQNDTVYVEDLASYTGVKVNGARIVTATPVAEGDEVFIGDYKLMLRVERPYTQVNPDRPTMPAMPAALGPMNAVGGSIAIPTRGTPAAMAAAQAAQAAVPATSTAPFPMPAPGPPPGAPAATPRASAPRLEASPRAEAAVPEALDAQPTIPVRALGEGDVDGEVAARLVVLTTELAGKEYPLARASVVIGRTEENDFVLNHRSISRHHAKIVRDGGRYTIVDLQSANGVRVNREDYERIDLKAGDVVELGHVKLRFVGPQETYVFDPSARHDRPAFPVKVALGGAGAIVLVGVLAFALRGSHSSETPAPTAPPSAAAAAPAPAPAALLAEATTAASTDDWAAAAAALEKLPPALGDAGLELQAADLRKRVATEQPAAALFAELGTLAEDKHYAEALARYGEIPDDSVYKLRGRTRAAEARALLIAERLAFADQARAAGRCDEVRDAVAEVEQLEPSNQLGKQIVRLCRPRAEAPAAPARPARAAHVVAATAARPERAPERERPGEKVTEPASTKRERPAEKVTEPASTKRERPAEKVAEAAPAKREEPEEAPADADALMKQAREAWLRQQCGSAIDLSRRALKAKPGLADAYQIIAVCSCSLKDAEGATRAYAKLDEKNRNLVHSLCQKNGIIVGGE
jgi:pSer/pThr/pTyr-binding forkhead associated (FHA) protein